ncbi:hypothetical protein [Pseudarthrobacter enclensis]|uniref:Enolase C-terminal domain-containing protein n=1 Tax=Pseudarthrobacter enclensis TaxID=993070 RepID=A0ABT9RRE0_9MICC|nr:hypothetical protein [Pseudarthrobacter enclensis]MDP9887243.1 hypothetical protein [Pseudarthrobacter enclensis]
MVHDHVWIENLFFDGTLEPDCGWVRHEDRPGNGLSLPAADADPFRVR